MISHDYRTVFIHQRKTAGSSIIRSFGLTPEQKEWHFLNDGVLSKEWSRLEEEAPDYFLFACVRNPYDRAVSAWKYIRQLRHKPLADVLRHPPHEGEAFRHFTRPQADTLLHPATGAPITHMLMRYESLQEDYDEVCRRIGKPLEILPRRNRGLWRRRDWRRYYTTETATLAEALFARDFEAFGYSAHLFD